MTKSQPPDISKAQKIAEEILTGSDLLKSCLDRSYRHPNGFTKIVLSTDRRSGSYRLHHWNGQSLFVDDVHCHRWDLCSHVLRGTFDEYRYEHHEVTDDPNALLYDYTRAGLRGQLINPRPVRCEQVRRLHISVDAIVPREADLFHRLVCTGDGRGLTLVHTDPPLTGLSQVIRNYEDGAEVTPASRPPVEEVVAVLEEFAAWRPEPSPSQVFRRLH